MKQQQPTPEFFEDFHMPVTLDVANLSAYSPFLVPQDHLGHSGVFMGMSAFMLFLFIAGTAINVLTIVCTIQYKKLRSHLNYILVNLAVSNLWVSVFGSSVAFYAFYKKYFVFGPIGCKIEGFTSTIGGMVSLWSLAVVALERWLVICKPLGNFTFKTPHAIAGCILPWCMALAAGLPPLLGWSRYIPEGLQCSCGPDWYTTNNKFNNESYVMFLFCFCFAVPFSTIVFCYGQLLITLKLAAKAQADSASTQKAEKEVTKMVVVMVFGFLLCWGPYALFAIWVVSNRGAPFDLRLATIPSCLCKASTVYNPVIYVLMNKQFRSCMMKMVFNKNIEEDEASSSSQVTQVSSVAPEK
ncbi:opsin-1, short-wave-sensitive 2 [Danio aesculapii]|uniref:opsin-1, short-wave-sensitive 2 n=1 Tax=Danio aesculapii TaxID=1142201 RepID=UPI0024BF54C5|nr:opsin-1, short-wave-sensitive 2 [Danio aesculapii]